jgi:RHS repeat-associated protein
MPNSMNLTQSYEIKRDLLTANELNQYTEIAPDGGSPFVPQFDADGNQTLLKTNSGIWTVNYNANNRPTKFTSEDEETVIECAYDYMGRRYMKKVTVGSSVTLHQRYIYRGYLQIACVDLTRTAHPALWYITWDPSQPIATRPLAIQKDGTWYCYAHDQNKNICEIFGPSGYIRTTYAYTPFGQVTAAGDVTQPIQWSSEYYDAELSLVYYNYRHYNPQDGRWPSRDPIGEVGGENLYGFAGNDGVDTVDFLGLWETDAHNAIIVDWLRGITALYHGKGMMDCKCCTINVLQILMDASAKSDGFFPNGIPRPIGFIHEQSASSDAHHAMKKPRQSEGSAKSDYENFLNSKLGDAKNLGNGAQGLNGEAKCDALVQALQALGGAFHALSDSYSPKHRGFQEWAGIGWALFHLGAVAEHAQGENLDTWDLKGNPAFTLKNQKDTLKELHRKLDPVLNSILKGCKPASPK